MKNSLRILALVCALLMVFACFVGCKKEKGGEAEVTTTVNAGDVTTTDGKTPSSLPAADWGGETCLVLGHSAEVAPQFSNFEIWRAEMTDDVVGKAVWERNNALADQYKFFVEQELVREVKAKMVEIYDSGEDLYDICLYRPLDVAQHAEQEYLLDLTTVEYIDLDHPSWDQNANRELAIGGHLYFTINDFLLQDKDRTELLFYNREMARETGKGYLEDMVENNTWTVAEFGAIVKEFSTEGNGNGQQGEWDPQGNGDNFGLGICDHCSFTNFCFGAGLRISQLDEDGNIVVVNDQENAVNVVNALGAFIFDTDQTLFAPDTKPVEWSAHAMLFGWEKIMFINDMLSSLDRSHSEFTLAQAISFEYSYLPYPKYSSTQERYYSCPAMHTGATVSIPYTVTDPAQAGFFLQALAEVSTETSLDAYYEVKCKIQNSEDDRAADMLDLIFGSMTYDVAVMYDFGKLYSMFTQMAEFKMNRYAKWFPQRYETALTEIATVMANYNS